MRWTVEHPVPRPGEPSLTSSGPTRLDFLSETGEHRSCTVLALEDGAWEGVNELAWRTLLRRIRSGRASGGLPRPPDSPDAAP